MKQQYSQPYNRRQEECAAIPNGTETPACKGSENENKSWFHTLLFCISPGLHYLCIQYIILFKKR